MFLGLGRVAQLQATFGLRHADVVWSAARATCAKPDLAGGPSWVVIRVVLTLR